MDYKHIENNKCALVKTSKQFIQQREELFFLDSELNGIVSGLQSNLAQMFY